MVIFHPMSYIINLINQNKIAITYLDYGTTNKAWGFLWSS
ncbi:hypothetical protein VCHA50O413_10113 [Vibrio chagasii]|nr:hypothetical protein VCHA50O409_10113 [Vibrio chagasii]CAH6964055.1 hypothetical protein VCHA50O402_10113 [Vibrio chagasii]CAH7018802.1 hypothetical protein VCHA50O413_10113 [Vibrio chagasii]CAH7055306.1 hypothetical protein VCHA34P114_80114 [Vibrio chagasii]CAH7348199.1 hypothetical protein VCHA50O405_60113 [Vibrio chagasii]